MRHIASLLGLLMVVDGIFDFVFPGASIRFWTKGPGAGLGGPFSAMARDFSDLETGSLRYLAGSEILLGGLIYWLSSRGKTETVAEGETIRIRPGRTIVHR